MQKNCVEDKNLDDLLRQCAKLFPSNSRQTSSARRTSSHHPEKEERIDQGDTMRMNTRQKQYPSPNETRDKHSENKSLRGDDPRIIGRYHILARIGQGGMGKVYKALDTRLGRIVALKVFKNIGEVKDCVRRFRREARANAKLRHPNIVTLHDFQEKSGVFFLVMQYIDGISLDQSLKEDKPSIEEACQYILTILRGLGYAHSQKIIHRDVKPSNILLEKQTRRLYITDFGIAKAINDNMSQISLTGEIVGTPTYMSPEQAKGEKADHRSDIYSIGVMFYEMLTGRPPFIGDNAISVLYKLSRNEIPAPSKFNPLLP